MQDDSTHTEESGTLEKSVGGESKRLVTHTVGASFHSETSQYTLIDLIGHGSSGDVWKASTASGADVALKLFKRELLSNEEALRRFNLEAKLLRRISHPNIVSILDMGETGEGIPFIVMDLVQGDTIRDRLNSAGVFAPDRVAQIGREICRALSAAHAQTVIHRDLKPSNVIIADSDDVRLVDFGISKAVGYTGETITEFGGMVGTPAYMSPEQCLGKPVDARSDIYALGCTLFEMLTGTKAFESGTPVEAIAKQISPDRQSLRVRLKATGAPLELQSVIWKCIQREPSERYQTAVQVEHDLSAFLTGAPLHFVLSSKPHIWSRVLVCFIGFTAAIALFWPNIVCHLHIGTLIRNRYTNQVVLWDPWAPSVRAAIDNAVADHRSLRAGDFRNAAMVGCTFRSLDMELADFTGAQLTGSHFIDTNLCGANFSNAQLGASTFMGGTLSRARFQNAVLQNCKVSPSTACTGADFSDGNLLMATFDGVNCREANFTRADLQQTSFHSACCNNANFTRADLQQTLFRGASCDNANFQYAILSGTEFEYTSLRYANFAHCTPDIVRASHADLTGTGARINEEGELVR